MSASLPATLLIWTLKFSLVLLMAALSRGQEKIQAGDERHVQIVVLGDIGRSPRMQYQALSISKHGGYVDLIGYQESKIHPDIVESDNITIHPLRSFPAFLNTKRRTLFVILGPLKVLFQIWALWSLLYVKTRRPSWMLVQNPPSIPTLAVTAVVCQLRNTRLAIDWHNFGYSILSLKLGRNHPLVLVSRLYEGIFGRLAHVHICVTNAMARALRDMIHASAPVLTLHDRPASLFKPMSQAERLEFLDKSVLDLSTSSTQSTESQMRLLCSSSSLGISSGLAISQNTIQAIKDNKARFLVSSTSWTPDEDFSILLDALKGYCETAQNATEVEVPEIIVIVTGKGPQRASFETRVEQMSSQGHLSHVSILTAYFDNVQDYARLLGSADLGVSLHTSSSGVDLPMKVLDMFGAGLPVVGWSDFEAWPELVQEGKNGQGFKSAEELQQRLENLFVTDTKSLKRLQKGALEEGSWRWEDEWGSVCGELFDFVK